MKKDIDIADNISISKIFNRPARSIIEVDIEKYKALLDDATLSEAEKEAFLQALWSIVVAFVDLGFGVHPLQEVVEDGQPSAELKQAFDRTEHTDSNGNMMRDDCPAGGLDME